MAFWQQLFDRGDGIEVKSINSYAVFMAYLSMAIKGLGFLVLTWTTVVLLGGFVSILHRKDFWCLTFITLVQTAGIFDVNMNEKLGYMKNAFWGLLRAITLGVIGGPAIDERGVVAFVCLTGLILLLMLLQVAVLAIILGPLAIIYVLGIFISGVIALWRLIEEHDYGGNSDGEASNLAPAMDTLYYLALLQGVLLCYRFVLGRVGKRLSKYVATEIAKDSEVELVLHNYLRETKKGCEIAKDSEVELVLHNYLRETKKGCEKNPAFAEGRNLITFALDKIGSNSPDDCSSGVNILYVATIHMIKPHEREFMLMKHLIFSTTSSQYILQKLLEMLDSRGLHDRKTTSQAAAILERLALFINLEQFPRGIQHISSLIGTSEEYIIRKRYLEVQVTYEGPSPVGDELEEAYYKELLLQGFTIIQNLAADENNCRVMSDTRGLVSKIMAPVTFDLLHTTHDGNTWYKVVYRSMEVMRQLAGAQGETGAKLRHEIASCEEAIITLQRILCCNDCAAELKQSVIWILTCLYMDTIGNSRSIDFALPKNKKGFCGEDFVRLLVDIFDHNNKYTNTVKGYAGEALSEICFRGGISDATAVIQRSGDVADNLTQVLLRETDETCRQAAAEILEHLCTHYTKDDEYLCKLKKAILKVFGKLLCSGEGTHNGKDIESQCDGTQENNEQDKKDEGFQVESLPNMSMNMLSSLVSLCGTVYNTTLIIDLSPQLDASSFLNKLKEILGGIDNPAVENLSLCKATGNMVISMLKYYSGSDRSFKQEDFGSLIDALSSASKKMGYLDYSLVCSSSSSSENRSKLHGRTLASLVGEAQVMHSWVPSTSFSG